MSAPGIEPATFGFLARHLACLAIGKVDYLRLKLLLYSEVTGNVMGVSKHAMIQYISNWLQLYYMYCNRLSDKIWQNESQESLVQFLAETYNYFYFEFFACFPSLQLGWALSNGNQAWPFTCSHCSFRPMIWIMINHTRPCILIATV